jgi:shikimate dehydrogenase
MALKQNGRLYFIDRPLSSLIPTPDRPLSSTREDIEKRYNERYPIYTSVADCVIDARKGAEDTAGKIINTFFTGEL